MRLSPRAGSDPTASYQGSSGSPPGMVLNVRDAFSSWCAVIEVISYFVRPVSHSIRLAGNVMAGHAVIKVFAAFAPLILISGMGFLVTPLSILAITAMYGLEVLVAFIQAYVFTILTCVYLKDALHPGH